MRHFFGSVFVQEDDHIELEYYIQENGFASYSNITTNYDEIVNFTQCLMENSAYPENLPEYVEDYLYEKRTNELMGDAVINA